MHTLFSPSITMDLDKSDKKLKIANFTATNQRRKLFLRSYSVNRKPSKIFVNATLYVPTFEISGVFSIIDPSSGASPSKILKIIAREFKQNFKFNFSFMLLFCNLQEV